MRAISIILIWLTALALALTLLNYGMVEHYWYANNQGLGYDLTRWRGDTLDNVGSVGKGYRFRYSTFRFEKNAEIRTIAIIVVFSCAFAGTILLIRHLQRRQNTPKDLTAPNPPPSTPWPSNP
jgi:hypothetical protein